ncbi:MAG: phosphoribosylamine--glycine ligase [Patescibacteria group bacterium]
MKKKINILVIGGGGREHALVWKIAQSPRVAKIFVAPGNGGTAKLASNIDIKSTDFKALINFAKSNQIGLTIVGPDDPLALGIVDSFQKAGLRIFGPSKKAARIESSKIFSKNLMKAASVPTAKFRTFNNFEKALSYIKLQNMPIVIKANGLALGKGVSICNSLEEAKAALKKIMVEKAFGASGDSVVIEEYLGSDQELSIHCITDGKTSVIFPTSQDHKQIFDGDIGPNTGGMGTYAPVPWAGKDYLKWAENKVIKPVLVGLKKKNIEYAGCLYPGLKLTKDGPKVLEFNARFGDPETQSYMRLLDSDLIEIIEACIDGKLKDLDVKWKLGFAACIIIASKGYPASKSKEIPIVGIDGAEKIPNVVVFHSGTKIKDGGICTSGGRVLGVTATGKTLKQALDSVYQAVDQIKFEGMQFRTDIGAKAFLKSKKSCL